MLDRDQHCAGGDVLDPAIFELEAADRLEQPDGNRAPQAAFLPNSMVGRPTIMRMTMFR
jgi:hypothetical protein